MTPIVAEVARRFKSAECPPPRQGTERIEDPRSPIPACVANNENHNSRVAMFVAQEYPCGAGVESKISTSTGVNEDYLALRAGNHLESAGTVRASRAQ